MKLLPNRLPRFATITSIRAISLSLFTVAGLALSAGPAWSTPVASGLQLWLDGTDPDGDGTVEGISEANIVGANVIWADKSGNSRNFSQATVVRQPTYTANGFSNSKGAFDFTGSNGADANGDTLFYGGTGPLAPGDDDYTYVVVWNADLHNQFRYPYTQGDGAGNGERAGLILSNTTYGFNGFNNDANGFVPSSAGQNNLTILQADNNNRFGVGGGPNIRIYDEGNLYTATTGSPAALNIQQGQTYIASSVGTGEFFDGKIAEIMVYDRVLKAPEINQVGNYLETKYGITWTDVPEPLYWDLNGTSLGSGGPSPSGNWNGVAVNWNSDEDGGAAFSMTATTTSATPVVFSAGADATGSYTVTVVGAQAAGGIAFQDGSVTLSGGSVTTSGTIEHTTSGTTTLNTSTAFTGALNFTNGKLLLNGVNTGTMGAWTIQNGGNQANGWLEVTSGSSWSAASISVTGAISNAVMKQTGGTLATTGNYAIGTTVANTNAYSYMSGGTLNVGGDFLVRPLANVVNANASAFFIMSGGTVNANGTQTFLGSVNNGGQSTIVMSGGTFTSDGNMFLSAFQDAQAYLVMGGNSTVTVDGAQGIRVGGSGVQNRAPGQIYLSESSVLTTNKIFKNSLTAPTQGASTLFFNGGTLVARATNNTDFLGPAGAPAAGNNALGNTGEGNFVRIFSGGAVIDTNGFDVTVNPALLTRPGVNNNSSIATISGIGAGNAGANYSIAPNVGFSGGGGSGAAGYVTLDGNGGIAAIVITDPGTGYTSSPTITLSGGTLGPAGVAANPGGWTVNLRSATVGGLTKIGDGVLTLVSTLSNYTGATTVNAGVLSINSIANGGGNSLIGSSSNAAANLVLNGGTLRYTGAAVSTDRLFSVGTGNGTLEANGSGAVNFTNTGAMGFNGQSGARTLSLIGTNTGDNTIAAVIGDNGGATTITKNGTGRWVLSGDNTYAGNTNVLQGTLALSNANSNNISQSPTISLALAGVLDTNGLNSGGGLVLAAGQTLQGTGTINGNLTVDTDSFLSPGASPGTLNQTGIQTWNAGGNFVFQINDATGTAGADPGWNLMAISGQLDLSALSAGNEFNVILVSLDGTNAPGDALNFDPSQDMAWMFIDATTTIATFTGSNQFDILDTAFSNSYSGTFSVVRGDSVLGGDDSQLWLQYAAPTSSAAVPEPASVLAWLVVAMALAVAGRRKWMRG